MQPVLPHPRGHAPGLWVVLVAVAAVAGGIAAIVPLLTRFAPWDDEGYMLISLAHYLSEGHLYTITSSQYGPFYFYAQGVFFQLLRLPVNHDMGRLATAVYWITSSLLAALFVRRATGSALLACAAGLCGMLAGQVLSNEPGHPQQVVLLLYMVGACLSLPSPSGRFRLRLFLLGCIGTALICTKVNVGVFYIAGLTHTVICLTPSGRLRSAGIALTLIYALVFPWLLMRAGFNAGFLGYFVIETEGGVVAFACGALILPNQPLPLKALLYTGAGLLAATALIVAATSAQGVSLASLIWGVILSPLRRYNSFYYPPRISRPDVAAALALSAVMVLRRSMDRRLANSRLPALVRCASGICSIGMLAFGQKIHWVVPLLPLTLIPRPSADRDAIAVLPRLFVTDMAVTQFLEPYPVAGSQLGIAAAPMLLWAFLCLADGLALLRTVSRDSLRIAWKDWPSDAMVGAAIVVCCATVSVAQAIRVPLPPASAGLRGASWLHLPADQAAGFVSIANIVNVNCDMLFTLPGMLSFNMWSGVSTPNGWNLTAWTSEISTDRQAEILSLIMRDPRACAIVNRGIARFWDEDATAEAALPLANYILSDMPEYEIRVHPRRNAPWSNADAK